MMIITKKPCPIIVLTCHDMKAFKPASKFDHNKTEYKLTGKHIQVDCKECHKEVTKNGKKFQVFADRSA